MTAPVIEQRAFREVVGHYASAVTVVSGMDGAEPVGFTCQSFYSVSLEPPLVSFSPMKSSTSYPRVRRAGSFAVNLLGHDQQHISNRFARSGTDKWAGVEWSPSELSNPILQDAVMWIDCTLEAEYEAGDHYIVVGRVHRMGLAAQDGERSPLVYYRGEYRRLADIEQ